MDGPGAEDADPDDGSERPRNKVARLVERYDLADVAAELEAGWTATGEAHQSLRELADRFNRRLLERQLSAAGRQPLDDEVGTLYALLTDGNESDRVRVRRRLERAGVDVEELREEFVSYQTVRRYLRDHREVTYARRDRDRVGTVARQLQELRGRVDAVTRSKLEGLQETDVTLGSFRTTVDVRVYCEDCATQHEVSDLLERGGCDCG